MFLGWEVLSANRSMDLEYCDRASIRSENAVVVHEAAVNSEPNILMADIHPSQPHQTCATVAVADAVEVEAELESGAGVAVGAGAETWGQAEPGPDDEVQPVEPGPHDQVQPVEPGPRMRQANISAASL